MNYLGGKHRQGRKIAEIVCRDMLPGQTYIEPFCGAMGVAYRVANIMPENATMVLSDAHPALMCMWGAIINDGWNPPSIISNELYNEIKAKQDLNDPMTAYVGFGMSFGSKYFGGYARNGVGTDYALNLQRSTILKAKTILKCCDYREYGAVTGATFYLDPPYANRTAQSKLLPKFNSSEFWGFVRHISKANRVYVTEFVAPEDFIVVHDFGDTVVRHHSSKGKDGTSECVFTLRGHGEYGHK